MIPVDTKVRCLENLLVAYQRLVRMLNDESKSDLGNNWNEWHARFLAYAKLAGVLFECEGVSADDPTVAKNRRPGNNALTTLGASMANIRRDLESGGDKATVEKNAELVYDKFSELLMCMATEIRRRS